MKEDLLHFIWKYKKLQLGQLVTTKNEAVIIHDVGSHNLQSGPDFFNAKVNIAGQLWAGNVEIHIKSSDWFTHSHDKDPNYDSIILHVVWEDDGVIYRSDGTEIPALELRTYIPDRLLNAYQNLFDQKNVSFINCENDIGDIERFAMGNWIERLYFERLERKTELIEKLLKQSKNDWEHVLFSALLKSFGLNINGEAFLSLAHAIDFSIVRKVQSDIPQLESIFFGMAHLLDDTTIADDYYLVLRKEFGFLGKKFNLDNTGVQKPEFFKLRPSNFPTIRLSQLANLYGRHQGLFATIQEATHVTDFYSIFDITSSSYWNSHYTFGKPSRKSTKKLSRKFIDLLIINTILPIKFCYAKHLGIDLNKEIVTIISEIKKEKNSIVERFTKRGVALNHAKDSQGVLELYKSYCTQNKCLQCAIGNRLLSGNS